MKKKKGKANGPDVRIVAGVGPSDAIDAALSVKLAHTPGAQGDNILLANILEPDNRPALLVSYVYLKYFLPKREQYSYRDWVLDSGAFSAYASGKEINLDDYIKLCLKLQKEDKTLTEIFALDVIGDWKASLKNVEKMWKAGIEAIPCYHINEPAHVLKELAAQYPKIAIGGVARMRKGLKMKFAEQVFSRIWPKKIHGFGYGSKAGVLALPWHSVDATNWELGPCGFGRWNTFGQMSVRGSKQNLRAEIEYYLRVEREARRKWKKEMAELARQPAPSVRLAMVSGEDQRNSAIGMSD